MTALAQLFLTDAPVTFLRTIYPLFHAAAVREHHPDPTASALAEVERWATHMLTTEGCAVDGEPVRPARVLLVPWVAPVRHKQERLAL